MKCSISRPCWGRTCLGNPRRSVRASCSPFPTMGFCVWRWRGSRPSPSSPRPISGSPSTCWGVDQILVGIAGSNRGTSQRCAVCWRMPRSRSLRATIPMPSRERKWRPAQSGHQRRCTPNPQRRWLQRRQRLQWLQWLQPSRGHVRSAHATDTPWRASARCACTERVTARRTATERRKRRSGRHQIGRPPGDR